MASSCTILLIFEETLLSPRPVYRKSFYEKAGVAQLVELQPSKLNVASSSLVSRSIDYRNNRCRRENGFGGMKQREVTIEAHVAQSVERFLGKEEVHRFDSGRGLHPVS
jgi:hypothetical protein